MIYRLDEAFRVLWVGSILSFTYLSTQIWDFSCPEFSCLVKFCSGKHQDCFLKSIQKAILQNLFGSWDIIIFLEMCMGTPWPPTLFFLNNPFRLVWVFLFEQVVLFALQTVSFTGSGDYVLGKKFCLHSVCFCSRDIVLWKLAKVHTTYIPAKCIGCLAFSFV